APADDRPAVLARVPGQHGIGIHRHRMGYRRQQRKVVVRVAVEPGTGEPLEPVPKPRKPVPDPRELSRLKTGHSGRASRKAPRVASGLGRNEMGDAIQVGDRPGDEAVRRRHDSYEVPGREPLGDLGAAFGQKHRPDLLSQEALAPGEELLWLM